MPRISLERREANRATIVAAARRCFSREGFHQTSMPGIAAEAGVSTGAPYRYFSGKEEIILEIAGDAFRFLVDPVIALIERDEPLSMADLVAAAICPMGDEPADMPLPELLRCAVQAWAELLRHEKLRERAQAGFDQVRQHIADALEAGQRAGTVPGDLDPDNGSRLVMAVLHGVVLQRVAFDLHDLGRFTDTARAAFA